jgi:ribosomal-protein-alanine N-acetyltransferase
MLPVLKTLRLVLTPLAEQHLSQLLTVAGDRAIADTTISVPHPLTELAARAWIDRAAAESHEGLGAHFAVAIRPDEDTLVGYVAIKAIDREHDEGELSFWLEERRSGQGYTTEAARAVVALGFGDLYLNRICAFHMVRNPASGRVLTKLGFSQEGCLRQRVRKWGIYEDVLVWAKLRHDTE